MSEDSGTIGVRYFQRLTLNQRIQHIVLILSFSTLVLTGLPIKYPESWLSSKIIWLLGGFAMRSGVHRFAAIIMILLTIYHIGYSIFTKYGRSEVRAFIPNLKDAFDAFHLMKYYVGLAPGKPRCDRYNFIEKFEYLAVGWGSIAMIGTGLMLWFPVQAMMFFPKWALDVAKIVHSYEALLAFLAIIIWHFYNVHLNPDVFPMSKIWLTGKISEHDMKEHHPLEYERIIRDLEGGNAGRDQSQNELERSNCS